MVKAVSCRQCRRSVIALIVAAFLASGGGAIAQQASPPTPGRSEPQSAGLSIVGLDNSAQRLSSADLAGMGSVEVTANFKGEHGEEHALYKGPLLWTVLDRAGLPGKGDMRARLRHAVLVTGRDGYAILLSIGELDPDFEGKQVIVAVERDGKPNPDGQLRMIVPGDRRGGRAVRDVVEIRFL
jgi:hypothetical protein